MKESARIDKWLWAARIYKTRSIAADACKNGRVMVGGVTRKPSFIIKRGDVVSVKKAPITYSFEVLDCIEQRVGAKMLFGVYKNVTDPKQYELEMHFFSFIIFTDLLSKITDPLINFFFLN